MFGDLEGMPMLLPLDGASAAADKTPANILDVFQQARHLGRELRLSMPSFTNARAAAICVRQLRPSCLRPRVAVGRA